MYDLTFDPQECRNLAADPALATVRDDLAGRLLQWMQRTKDPLLKGPLPLPAGGITGDQDAMTLS